ncbi:MAG: ATP-binding protein [Gemmatimonadota bacterium]
MPAPTDGAPNGDALLRLRDKYAELQLRLDEAEDTLRALRAGEADAIVVGDVLYTLESADAASNRFRGDVLSQMSEPVVATDADDHITYVNMAAQSLYGPEASTVLGRPLRSLYRVPSAAAETGARAAAISGVSWRGPSVHERLDGSVVHVEVAISPLRDAGGTHYGTLAVMRDVSDRRRAEALARERELEARSAAEALRQADRRKDEFLATLAHELRNPMAPITASLAIMKLSSNPQDHASAQNVIERQVTQLVHLVDDLLDVGRISQGKLELRRKPLDLNAAIQAAVESTRPLLDRRRHALSLSLAEPPLRVDGDLTRLTQVFANVLDNAVKYTPEGGRISLHASVAGNDAVVTIRDNGIGVSEAMMPEIFTMFSQVREMASARQTGLGIGLALVKRLVELHGGSVVARSEGSGLGLEVAITLPLLAATEAVIADPDIDAARPQTGRRGLRVMVADDNEDCTSSLAAMLQLMGCQTVTALNGEEAVAMAAEFQPDLAVLDIGMPRLDGHAAARKIRAARQQEITLVALTGWGQPADRSRSAAAGFDHHWVKPVDPAALEALLNSISTP